MSHDNRTASRQSLRGTDSNSLLRLHDQAREVLRTAPSRLDRARAEKALRHITEELDRRGDDRAPACLPSRRVVGKFVPSLVIGKQAHMAGRILNRRADAQAG